MILTLCACVCVYVAIMTGFEEADSLAFGQGTTAQAATAVSCSSIASVGTTLGFVSVSSCRSGRSGLGVFSSSRGICIVFDRGLLVDYPEWYSDGYRCES
jgi:predicted sugar kinase